MSENFTCSVAKNLNKHAVVFSGLCNCFCFCFFVYLFISFNFFFEFTTRLLSLLYPAVQKVV